MNLFRWLIEVIFVFLGFNNTFLQGLVAPIDNVEFTNISYSRNVVQNKLVISENSTSLCVSCDVPIHSVNNSVITLSPTPEITRVDDTVYDLVLFTTEDSWNGRIENKTHRWRDMVELYHKHYSFQAVYFTRNPMIINMFSNTSVKIVTEFELTRFNLPVITNMFMIVSKMYDALYYGYLNADILLEYTVFDALKFLQKSVERGELYPRHELAGRVYEKSYDTIPYSFPNLDSLKLFFGNLSISIRTRRNHGSADYFIFSRESLPLVTNSTHKVVIGRREIDNYLMGIMWKGKNRTETVDLIDGTVPVHGIHIGRDGFMSRKARQSTKNIRWNFDILNGLRLHHGVLGEKGNRRLIRRNNNYTIRTIK